MSPAAPSREFSFGGIMSAKPLKAMQADERRAAADRAALANNSLVVQSLVGQIRRHWTLAKIAKQDVELKMLDALRSKRGEYSSERLAQLKSQGSSDIFMMLFATKARQAKALLADVVLGTGVDKPWTINPTPDATLPPELVADLLRSAAEMVQQAEMGPTPMDVDQVRQLLRDAKEKAEAAVAQEALVRCKRAEVKMEDYLYEGGFLDALDSFIDDLMVFPTAFLKGPVIRRRGTLTWAPGPDGTSVPTAAYETKPHWERVDALNLYPAPWSRTLQDGFLIERHRLEPSAISELIGVDGYNEDAIRQVMDAYSAGGLREWLTIDSERARLESASNSNPAQGSDLIDAIQYWGSATGKLLREWGLTAEEVPDEAKVYEIEAWLVGEWVIKAVINTDPLNRRPYYGDSFERVPGALWGVSLYDTMRDCEDMCNACARALSNNMGIASGPQVWVDIQRLATGQDITTLYPWKITQTVSDPNGSTAAPMGFFQPQSNANELMAVFEKFSTLADEVTGIPRYMTGDGAAGGAGRTASGMSMMIGNASKTTKKTIASIDMRVISPVLRSLYEFIMRYVGDPDIKGDLKIVARGAMSLVTKDSAQVRRNEFLQFTANPIDMQIMGMEGRAAVLRESAKTLDMNTDDIVPSLSILRQRIAMANMQQAAQQAQGEASQTSQKPGERRLMNDAPATDTFA
jgi:hypothetical protein